MTPWHQGWQDLAVSHVGKHAVEVRGIGDDPRPRDVACPASGCVVELQHSFISTADFEVRNATVPGLILWIFNATEVPVWKYGDYEVDNFRPVCFCQDTFRKRFPTSENKVVVLFQCSDGLLRQALCDEPALIEIPGNNERQYVRLLTHVLPIAVSEQLDSFFGAGNWPLRSWEARAANEPPIEVNDGYVKVISVAGRELFDTVHRRLFQRFPRAPLAVFNGPPGSGKTSLIKSTVDAWTASISPVPMIIVVTFNASNAESLCREIGGPHIHVKTLDSLCATPFKGKRLQDPNSSDYSLLKLLFPDEVNKDKWSMTNKMKHGGGLGCSDIIKHRLTHPSAPHTVCSKHSKLTVGGGWDASLHSFPISKLVEDASTFASRRYRCDRDELLRGVLSKYDVIIVDEMQDLISAQEQRLIRQASCPVVMIGDMDQQINQFRHETNGLGCCDNKSCSLPAEPLSVLPTSIEFYGTYRLDELTVAFLEDVTGKRMFSQRRVGNNASIKWQTELQYPENTLIMCRSNEHVITTAEAHSGMCVVGGKDTAGRLESAYKDKSQTLPMAKFAHSLSPSRLEQVCKMLRARSISLGDIGGRSAVATVHKCKGYECDHTAVHSDLVEVAKIEPACLFVAMSRHRESLTILSKPVQSNKRQASSVSVLPPAKRQWKVATDSDDEQHPVEEGLHMETCNESESGTCV